MKKTLKRSMTFIMAVVVIVLSIVTVFAVQYDNNNITYSYSETGDCTVVVGDTYYVSNDYIESNEFEINGHVAVCAWGVNPTPTAGTYRNATKYYLDAGAARAKAFYWLILSNSSAISASNRYDSSSSTYLDDIHNAMDDCGALYKSTSYGFVHSVIDYLQQGEINPWYDDAWNDTVVEFAELTRNYPNVPKEYRIFYFYPQGNAAQSLMSWEHTPHGYIKVVKSSSDTSVTNGNSNYSFKDIEYYVSKSKTDFDTSGNNYIGYIKLNAAGEGHSKDGSRETLRFLPPGTYYIKEGYIPSGSSYKRNNTVYPVNVTNNHTTTSPLVLNVSDEPKTCYGKIVKSSTKPEWTDNNPDYSFAGIRYSFSTSSTDFSPYGTKYIGYVELNEDGLGYTANGSRETLRKLAPGTYYVKESVIPEGCKYKLDNTVYTMTFTFNNDENNLKVLNVQDEPEGSSGAKIVKKSSIPEVSDGNTEYSFAGAEFTVYTSRADAEQKANPFITVTTDENGVSTISEISLGTYYVRETKAPFGFELSDEIKELSIETAQEEAYEVEFEDKPIIAPLSVLLKKVPKEGSQISDMSGAEYTVCFYNGSYDSTEALAGIAPTRTWVFGTDEGGNIAYHEDYCISGDDLYYDAVDDVFGLPLGTITFQETKAPDGFYLDEQTYLSQITVDSSQNIALFNYPVSTEESISYINISGKKTWDDGNNRDGKRPESVTVDLYRDNVKLDSFTMNAGNGWQYAFNNLEKGYADYSLDSHFHEYVYEVRESSVAYYTSDSEGLLPDSSDANHYICDFANHYITEKVHISGVKTWDDFNDAMGYRPESIKVILYRDDVKKAEIVTNQENNWAYSFPKQYKYHDGGIEYTYTVGEEPVHGYTVQVDGFNLKNELGTGSVRLHKTDESNNPLEDVSFKLYTENGESVKSITNGNSFKFWGLTDNDDEAEYTTNTDGEIFIDELPYGKYYFEETKTLLGFIPYGDKLWFEITGDSEETQNITVAAENARMVMPETGGIGTGFIYLISITLAGIATVMICISKRKTKGLLQ